MRQWKMFGEVGVLQLPAIRGYALLKDIKGILERIDANSIGDILMRATSSEMASVYEQVSFECTVDGLPFLDNDDFAFAYPSQMYLYIREAVAWNFGGIWDKDCVTLDHSPEFVMDQTQLLDPFFTGVMYEKLATKEQLETVYTVLDVAEMNEMLVVQANNEHRANERAKNSNSSGLPQGPRPGSIAGAMSGRT